MFCTLLEVGTGLSKTYPKFASYTFFYLDVTTRSSYIDRNLHPQKSTTALKSAKFLQVCVCVCMMSSYKTFLTGINIKSNRLMSSHFILILLFWLFQKETKIFRIRLSNADTVLSGDECLGSHLQSSISCEGNGIQTIQTMKCGQ